MSNLKQKHKDYLIKNEIKDLTDLVNYVEILRNTSNLEGEDRQMLFDFAFLITNEQLSLKSFFAENFRRELHNQLGITNNNMNVKSSDSCFTKTSDIIDEINNMDKNPSREFYNAFEKFAENEDIYDRVRANFHRELLAPTVKVREFNSIEDAKKYFNNTDYTEAFYYTYGTNELIEKEDKSKNSPTFMDEVLDLNTTTTEVPNFNLIDVEQILPKHIFDAIEKQEDIRPKVFSYRPRQEVGKKETEGKLFYELDFEFIKQMAERMQSNKDNSKYELWNWKKPMTPTGIEELKQAMWRHIIAVMSGELVDDGREFGHLEAISNNAMMINYQLKLKKC